MLKVSITEPVVVIGVVTFDIAFAGFNFGNKLGTFFKRKVRVIGGIVMIEIGIDSARAFTATSTGDRLRQD